MSVGWHWVVSTFLAIMINAAVNIQAQVFMWLYCQFPWYIPLRVKFLGHMVILCLSGWGTARLFQSDRITLYSCHWWWGLQCLHILTSTCTVRPLYCHHPNGHEVASHCGSDWHFLVAGGIRHVFMSLLAICMSSLEKCVFTIKNPFFIVCLFCPFIIEFCILNTIYILFFICFKYKSLIRYMICTHFLLGGLSFHFLYSVWVTWFQTFNHYGVSFFVCFFPVKL